MIYSDDDDWLLIIVIGVFTVIFYLVLIEAIWRAIAWLMDIISGV